MSSKSSEAYLPGIYIVQKKYVFLIHSILEAHGVEMVLTRACKGKLSVTNQKGQPLWGSFYQIIRDSLTFEIDLMLNLVLSRKSPTRSPT